jgi:protein involved in polysaccharide export with SLBB domain
LIESFVLEHEIDPESYILGPGDKLGLNIISSVNLTYIITITPTGHLWIPDIGTVHVSGFSIPIAEAVVKEYVQNYKYNSAQVKVVLMNLRRFKVQVIGAINNPGFVSITSADRLTAVIHKSGGLHKYAEEETVKIVSHNGNEYQYSLKTFEINGDLNNNPIIQEGDIIHVPYMDKYVALIGKTLTHKKNPVLVTGFVMNPGVQKYIPGYTIKDYVALSGGGADMGSIKNISIIRDGEIINPGVNQVILPGDQIHLPANMKYRFLGNISILQTTTAIMSLYLAFVAATN